MLMIINENNENFVDMDSPQRMEHDCLLFTRLKGCKLRVVMSSLESHRLKHAIFGSKIVEVCTYLAALARATKQSKETIKRVGQMV